MGVAHLDARHFPQALNQGMVTLAPQALGLKGAVEVENQGGPGHAQFVRRVQSQAQILILRIHGEARSPIPVCMIWGARLVTFGFPPRPG